MSSEHQAPSAPMKGMLRYPIAVGTALGTACIQLIFFPQMEVQAPFAIFFPAVALSALYGGIGAGLASTATSAFLAEYLFVGTRWSLDFNATHLPGLAAFLVGGGMVSCITEALHRTKARVVIMQTEARFVSERAENAERLRLAHERLRLAHEELELRVTQRTSELAATIERLHENELLLVQQSRMSAMGEMIQNIAHQWRQPLNSLGLNIQLLQMQYDKGKLSSDDFSKSVMNIMMLVQHMSGTIDDFREFFKPDKEKVEFRVSQVIERTIKLVETSFRSKGVAIAFHRHDDPVSYGYPSQYSQVLLNILQNAREAIEITCPAAPRVIVSLSDNNGRSKVAVCDNGGGIDDAVLFKIFDPHFTTKGPNGTGIGLFMAKNIIERNMEGSIKVRNTESGAEFVIQV